VGGGGGGGMGGGGPWRQEVGAHGQLASQPRPCTVSPFYLLNECLTPTLFELIFHTTELIVLNKKIQLCWFVMIDKTKLQVSFYILVKSNAAQ
jgi:hypothetical protein